MARNRIVDASGIHVGETETNQYGGVNVFDTSGYKLGYTDGRNTYDDTGTIIAHSDCPGLLLDR